MSNFKPLPAPVGTVMPDGTPITGIVSMAIDPVAVDGKHPAVIRMNLEEVGDIALHPILAMRTLEEWAALQGMALVTVEAQAEAVARDAMGRAIEPEVP